MIFRLASRFYWTLQHFVLSSFDFFVTKVVFRAYIYMSLNCSISELNQLSVSKITGVRPNKLVCMSVFGIKCPIKGFVRESKKL